MLCVGDARKSSVLGSTKALAAMCMHQGEDSVRHRCLLELHFDRCTNDLHHLGDHVIGSERTFIVGT